MRTAEFDYVLPPELIAQTPAAKREQSRLLHLDRATGQTSHHPFSDLISFLRKGDCLVLNNSRVIPARLRGVNSTTGGEFEILLLEENAANDWWAMMRPGKRARLDTLIDVCTREKQKSGIVANVIDINTEGHRRLRFSGTQNIFENLDALGEIPLPPYIHRDKSDAADLERYQTVYATTAGSVAAPTAGLHFTEPLLQTLQQRGINVCFVTLHVGLGTFAPVKAENISEHIMHEERYELSESTAEKIDTAKKAGHRVVAVGTTSVRVLESVAAKHEGKIVPTTDRTRIFIFPPADFKVVDALLTNFHLPCSTLLMLVSAFAAPGETLGKEMILAAYREAIEKRYRFFSYGDAMFIE